jgi:hypothetical protein
LPSRHGGGAVPVAQKSPEWHHDDVFGMDLERRGAHGARASTGTWANQSRPFTPLRTQFYHHDKFCQGIPSLRVLASRSPLRNMSRAVPLAASRAHHTYSSRLPFSSYWNRHVHLPKAKITIREPATTRRPASFRILASPFRSSLPMCVESLEKFECTPLSQHSL